MKTVWVTRSLPSAERFSIVLKSSGYNVVIAPVIDVAPTKESFPNDEFDVVVFLSAHAVRHALTVQHIRCETIVSIGEATSKTLEKYGVNSLTADFPSTEGLFSFLKKNISLRSKVLIVSGIGGREDLDIWLTKVGHMVKRWHVYRRIARYPSITSKIDVVEVASGDAVTAVFNNPANDHFFGMDTPLCVPSERVSGIALQQGFRNIVVCSGATPSDLLSSLAAIKY